MNTQYQESEGGEGDDSGMDQELEAARQVFTHEYREDEEKQTIKDRRGSYGSIQKAKVRTRHLQIHSVFHTCFPVQPHGRAGGLFRDFLFLPVGGKNEQMESVGIRDRRWG